ncbi:tail terminator [Streptomyces phage phiScoe15]|nr:tail terminator [Streptomyces phage phiScoe15]
MSGLPPEIKALAELSPVEDLLLALLREGLPGIQVKSLIAAHQTFPLVLIRRAPTFGQWAADTRFTDSAQVTIHTFCADPDGDEDAAILSEAVRVVLRDAWLGNKVVPGRGHLTRVDLTSAPRRVTDWATASGPVQYADLPTGVWRYESVYQIAIRKPRTRPYPTLTP